ncbi:MAG: hypothetical protein QUS08_10295 [Methanothrix sp.]|nr:hypothetical protein [Methanothrix sp.]
MAWTHYPLKFRLQSPMHIGYRKVGNLMQTRQYVPGKNLWAALTARIARDHLDGSDANSYKKIGEHAKNKFRFSYLWPSLDGEKPYFHWAHEDFDYLLLDSCASTALDHSAHSAEEGSLHETEFISPVTRDERKVYLLGDLWVKDGLPVEMTRWQAAMENLQLGGERTYGWGRLELCSDDWKENSSGSGMTAAGHPWWEYGGKIFLELDEGKKITSHALASPPGGPEGTDCLLANAKAGCRDVVGPVEPLVGWEWGSPARVCYRGVYFMPGGKVIKRARFKIDCFGRLCKMDGL